MADRQRREAQPHVAQRRPFSHQRLPCVFKTGGGTDPDVLFAHHHALQLGHFVDGDQLAQVKHLLRHPQTHVGAAGQHPRLRPGFAQRRKFSQRARGVEGAGCVQRRVLRQRSQGLQHGLLRKGHGRRRQHLLPRVQDRPVARAAAQVARQVIGQLLARWHRAGGLVALVAGPQAHHETRGAEAALRAVAIDHALLHRVQRASSCTARFSQVFHREQCLAVQRGQKLDAGVDRLQLQRAGRVQRTQHHRAGAAVAFGAAFLGAAAMGVFAQPLQHGAGGAAVQGGIDFDDRSTVKETHGAGVHRVFNLGLGSGLPGLRHCVTVAPVSEPGIFDSA